MTLWPGPKYVFPYGNFTEYLVLKRSVLEKLVADSDAGNVCNGCTIDIVASTSAPTPPT